MKDVGLGTALIIQTIRENKAHEHYERVKNLAELYLKLFTGEGIDTLLRQFAKREDDEMFQQRKDLYQTVMPAVANNLETVFMKPLRSNRVFSSVEHNSPEISGKLQEIKKRFWQGEDDSDSGLDAWLSQSWVRKNIYDPNAFVAIGFYSFNPLKEKPQSYPIEYSSTDVWKYEYINGVLDYLMIRKKIRYGRAARNIDKIGMAKDTAYNKDGEKFMLYLENDIIVFTEVDYEHPDLSVFTGSVNFETIDKRKFAVQIFNTKSGQVPAMRVGYKLDAFTNDKTCVSIFHPAVAFFKKELKAGSELDITMATHVFPQKIQYAKQCIGDPANNIGCRGGKNPLDGTTCRTCNGTGLSAVHTSAQDIIFVPMPKGADPIIDLDKYMVYKHPPTELLEFQNKYVDTLTEKARKAIFAGEALIRQSIQTTATEKEYNMDDVYDALTPFTKKYSSMWLFCMKISAQYIDANNEGLKLYHRFPKDFKLKSQSMVVADYDAAKKAGVPSYLLESLNNDLAEMMYSDDQDTLFKMKVKKKFNPFTSKTPEEIQVLLSSGKVPEFDQILYANFDMIFTGIDEEQGMAFYLRPYKSQYEIVKKRVEEIQAKVKEQQASRIPIPIEGDNEGNDNEPGLNGAPQRGGNNDSEPNDVVE